MGCMCVSQAVRACQENNIKRKREETKDNRSAIQAVCRKWTEMPLPGSISNLVGEIFLKSKNEDVSFRTSDVDPPTDPFVATDYLAGPILDKCTPWGDQVQKHTTRLAKDIITAGVAGAFLRLPAPKATNSEVKAQVDGATFWDVAVQAAPGLEAYGRPEFNTTIGLPWVFVLKGKSYVDTCVRNPMMGLPGWFVNIGEPLVLIAVPEAKCEDLSLDLFFLKQKPGELKKYCANGDLLRMHVGKGQVAWISPGWIYGVYNNNDEVGKWVSIPHASKEISAAMDENVKESLAKKLFARGVGDLKFGPLFKEWAEFLLG